MVTDIRNAGPYEAPRAEVYHSFRQDSDGWWSFSLTIRTRDAAGAPIDPASLAGTVSAAVRGVDPEGAVTAVRPMTEVMSESLGRPRFYLALLGTFGAVALALAVAGIYGVLSYAVAQRTREFGIRAALGATKLLVSLLYGVSPLDASAWLAATVTLGLAGFVAALLPAWRATRADPVVALRAE
jgi:putative ABC transport system permease protein